MFSPTFPLGVYSYGAAALFYSALATHVAQIGKPKPIANWGNTAFLFAVIVSSVWGWANVTAYFDARDFFAVARSLLDVAKYGLWNFFLLLLLRAKSDKSKRRLTTPLEVAAIVLVGLALALVGIKYSVYSVSVDARLALYSGLSLPVFGLVLVEQLFRNVADEFRWNAKPLCIALGCIFGFDVYLHSVAALFGRFDPDAVSIGGAIHVVAVPLLFVAFRRQSNWIVKFQISRTAAFHSATLMLAGAYLVFISAVGFYVRYFGGEWGAALQTGLLSVSLVALTLIVLSGAMRAKFRVLLGKHFFSYQYDYRKEWLEFTATLSANGSPQDMDLLAIQALANMIGSRGGSLWLRPLGGSELIQAARLNMPLSANRVPLNSPFCTFLNKAGWIIILDEYRKFPQRYSEALVPEWILSTPQAWLVVPLLVADELIGIVVLLEPKTAVYVNWEVTDLLKTASRQAATFLSQLHSTEALVEVRKFDAFNRMSAFVMHDLKNIVTQLSLMMQNAKRLHRNPEFQRDMLITVENSLDKMRQLMLQLRDGDPSHIGSAGVDLRTVARNIQTRAVEGGRVLEVKVVGEVMARGQEQRMERVIGHLVQNALDATPASGRVWLNIDQKGDQILVEVGDTGRGMTSDFVQNQLFKPFNTTKTGGLGIGAYESSSYVRQLGGDISVKSAISLGTVVEVVLPTLQLSRDSESAVLGLH